MDNSVYKPEEFYNVEQDKFINEEDESLDYATFNNKKAFNNNNEDNNNSNYNYNNENRATKINAIIELESIEPNLMYFCGTNHKAVSLIKKSHESLLKKEYYSLKQYLTNEVKEDKTKESDLFISVVKLFYLGICCFKLGQCEESLAYFFEALKIYDYYQINYNIALCYIKLDQLDNAVFYLEKVVNKNKNFIFAYYNLIKIYLKVDRPNDAYMIYKTFNDSLKKEKENQQHGISENRLSVATFNAYKLFYKLGAECCFYKVSYQDCVHTILEALKFNPLDPELFCLYAKVFIMKKNFDFAKPLLEKAIEINPNYKEANELLKIINSEY